MPHANSWTSIGRSVGSVLTPARTLALVCTLGPTALGVTIYWRDLASKQFVHEAFNVHDHGFVEDLPKDPAGHVPSAPSQHELAEALFECSARDVKLSRQIEDLRLELIEEIAARVRYTGADYERNPELRAETAARIEREFRDRVENWLAKEALGERCEKAMGCSKPSDASRKALEVRPRATLRRGSR